MTNLGVRSGRGTAAARGRGTAAAQGAAFRHDAVLYTGADGFVRATAPFLRDALGDGDPVLVMVEPRRIEELRMALGQLAGAVHFRDMTAVGRNPACIIPAWQEFVAEHAAPGVRLRGVGEPVWVGREPEEIVECQRHEALLNVAFADASAFWLVCPYDAGALDARVIERVGRTHAGVSGPGARRRHADPLADALAPGDPEGALTEPPPDHVRVHVTADHLGALRARAVRIACAAGLGTARTADLLLALSEAVHNSVEHGGGQAVVRIWHDDEVLVCDIRDAGHISDPLAGRRRPPSDAERGRGLWLVNQLCDLVQLRSSPTGTAIRLHMRSARHRLPALRP